MKLSASKEPEVFSPVTLTLTLETQKELDAVGSMFNNGRVIVALDKISVSSVWRDGRLYQVLQNAGANIHKSHEFCSDR